MKKTYRGSSTIELAYLLPVFFLMFQCIVFALFYYHDKNILTAAAAESAAAGTRILRMDDSKEGEITHLFKERITGHLILFGSVRQEISCGGNAVEVKASARKGRMQLWVSSKVAITQPEKEIRRIRGIKGQIQK